MIPPEIYAGFKRNITPIEIRKAILDVTNVELEDLKCKTLYKKYGVHSKKVGKIRMASQLLNYYLIDKLKLTSEQASKYSFRSHPTPLIATKVIKEELEFKSSRTNTLKNWINKIEEQIKTIK